MSETKAEYYCALCGNKLKTGWPDRQNHVYPCKSCEEAMKMDSYDTGYDDGCRDENYTYDLGYDAGCEAGLKEGESDEQ